MHNIEIEIKLKLDDPAQLLSWLQQNAEKIKETSQTDHYFDPPHKSYIYQGKDGTKDADEWFRIRITEKGNELCYKYWHRENGVSTYADEVETHVGDAGQMFEMFKRLGFTETSVIKKQRESYKHGNFQFDCDTVEGLGFFGEVDDPSKGKQIIFDFLKEIGVENWKKTKRGYSWIQWNPEVDHFE